MAKIFEKLIFGGLHAVAVIYFQIIFKISVRTSLETHYFSATHITPLTPQLYSRG
jgi:hypothetical protein